MINESFEEIFTYEALYRAHLRGRVAKRGKKPLVNFETKQLLNVYDVYARLQRGGIYKYRYHSFTVYEPKMRVIQTLCYADRVVQRVLCDNVLAPYFTRHAVADNCVCQKGKGTGYALARFENMLRSHIRAHGVRGWFLKCDVLKYFPSIPHENLKKVICKHIRDERLKQFITGIIDSFHTSPEYLEKYAIPSLGAGERTERGIPIGNQTSQIFGMFYLDPVDRFVKEKLRVKVYSRYMDDFVLVHEDKFFVLNARKEITRIVGELGLQLNEKTQIFPLKNGVTYLGFRYTVTQSGKVVKTVKKQTKRRLRWRSRLLKKAYLDGVIDADRVRTSLAAAHGHLCHSKSYRLQKELFDRLKKITNQGMIIKHGKRR